MLSVLIGGKAKEPIKNFRFNTWQNVPRTLIGHIQLISSILLIATRHAARQRSNARFFGETKQPGRTLGISERQTLSYRAYQRRENCINSELSDMPSASGFLCGFYAVCTVQRSISANEFIEPDRLKMNSSNVGPPRIDGLDVKEILLFFG